MSRRFLYVNDELKQYFYVGLFGHSDSLHCLGEGPGARALGRLLLPGGSWSGHPIRALPDVGSAYENEVYPHYVNVSLEAELMLLDLDGLDAYRDRMDSVFSSFCDYAQILGRKDVARFLDHVFGPGAWQRRYAAEQKANYCSSNAIHRAKERGLCPLRAG